MDQDEYYPLVVQANWQKEENRRSFDVDESTATLENVSPHSLTVRPRGKMDSRYKSAGAKEQREMGRPPYLAIVLLIAGPL